MPFFTFRIYIYTIMVMKKKYVSLAILPVILTGCNQSIKLEFSPYHAFIAETSLMKEETSPISTIFGDINSLRDLLAYSKSDKPRENINPRGDRKILVVPISFNDSEKKDLDKKTIFLQNAFFGEKNKTNYESVASYYNKSSYGQLRLTGEVAPWVNVNISMSECLASNELYMDVSNKIVATAVDYLKEHQEENHIDFASYDTDNNNQIDGIYAIYDYPHTKDGNTNSLLWAYTHYTFEGQFDLNKEAPFVNDYSWTSIDMITQKDNRAYTNYIIHETGHLLGLTDYYNTAFGSKTDYHYQPTGCFDMMDYNIGDHSSFSKYLYNWTSPTVIKDGTHKTIELHAFSTTGEYLLVPSSKYYNSPFGEYLLIEYFIPEDMNVFHGSYSYVDKYGNTGVYRYPTYYGLRIYHVNAVLGYFKKFFNASLICTVDDPNVEEALEGQGAVCLDYAYSNSITDKKANDGAQVLYHLLESSGNNTFINGNPASNDTLFVLGDDFGISTYQDFKFSNGESPNFTLKVTKLNTKYITLEINKA